MNETCIKHTLNKPNIGGCPYCEICRLNEELEEVANSWSMKAIEQFNRAEDLERQLADARVELERHKAGVEIEGNVCMQDHGASVPGLSAALLAYPHKVRVLIMKLEG